MKRIVVGITGASGTIYALRLIEQLLKNNIYVHIICTYNGNKVIAYENSVELREWVLRIEKVYPHVKLEEIDNLFSSVASGSYKFDAMVVVPCSMGTLGEISCGLSRNLLTRTADVALKEQRKLIIVPRETPLNAIHLENMLKLSRLGVTILPAMPGFYHKPDTFDELVDFVIGKILDTLSIENKLFKKWGANNEKTY